MIRLRHFLHPLRTAGGLYRRAENVSARLNADRAISSMKRVRRDSCWCGGSLVEFALKPNYGICLECGSYVNRKPPSPQELSRLYAFDFYWHKLQRLRGHPIIEERTSNDLSDTDGRVDYWLSLIAKSDIPGNRVLEVGCAHGVLLKKLSERGFTCTGVEVDPATADWTQQKTGIHVISGIFPDVPAPECDLFLAFDVIEHSHSPEAFLARAAELLVPGGIAVIQTPIEFAPTDPPFGEMFEKCFDDAQHLFLFSRTGIDLLARRSGFELMSEQSWRVAHEIVVLRKHKVDSIHERGKEL